MIQVCCDSKCHHHSQRYPHYTHPHLHAKDIMKCKCARIWVEYLLVLVKELLEGLEIAQDIRSSAEYSLQKPLAFAVTTDVVNNLRLEVCVGMCERKLQIRTK